MIIEISNINANNHHLVGHIAGIAGYAASVEVSTDTVAKIDLGDNAHRFKAGISVSDVERMLSLFIVSGFTVKKL